MTVLSLIIPMYNSEQTIERTLQSVIEQTVQFMEVIVVDNGSDDQSSEIVERICNKHSFIRLVHCAQRGVSAARNMGIELATSEYISFLDADDILESNYVEVLKVFVLQNPNANMYHFNFYQQFKNGIIKENLYFLHENDVYTGKEFMKKTYSQFSFEAKHMVWSFVFEKHFLDANKIRFNQNIHLYEDILFLNKAWRCADEIFVLNKSMIQYLYNAKSVTVGLNDEFAYESFQLLKKENIDQQYLLKLSSRVLSSTKFSQLWKCHYLTRIQYLFLKIQYILFKFKDR